MVLKLESSPYTASRFPDLIEILLKRTETPNVIFIQVRRWFMKSWQTVLTLIRLLFRSSLIWVYTVCRALFARIFTDWPKDGIKLPEW